MTARVLLVFAVAAVQALPARSQTIPDGSQASKVQMAYRRTPTFRIDPFRHVQIPHWGFVGSIGVSAANNTLNASDAGALKLLNDSDSLAIGTLVDVLGLVPRGEGLTLFGQGEGAFYLGGPFGGRVGFGIQARGTGYGSAKVDDGLVSLVRDGNGTQTIFPIGGTKGIGLATAEGGAHAIIRLGPFGSADAVKLSLGFGARYVRPAAFYRMSFVGGTGTIRVSQDSISANMTVEQAMTRDPVGTLKDGAHGWAGDFLVRFEWPTSGLALEALVANVGSVNVAHVEVATANLNVSSPPLQRVLDAVDTLGFTPSNSDSTLRVTLPRIVRFTASAWANRILQIDMSTTLPVTGEFESPLAVDIGTTWRFLRTLPLRVGMSIGGTEGLGFSGGLAVEGRTMFFQLAGQSLGGFMKNAKGAGLRLEFGLFF